MCQSCPSRRRSCLEEIAAEQGLAAEGGVEREDGESGNGIFRKSKKGENCEAWITYLIALK